MLLMSTPHQNTVQTERLGKSWVLSAGVLEMDASESAKQFIADEAAFAHSYYKSISQLLNVTDASGGVIIENEDWSLILGKFKTEMGALVSAEGEMIEVVTPDFDYCLANL
jgi:hypothetical protein